MRQGICCAASILSLVGGLWVAAQCPVAPTGPIRKGVCNACHHLQPAEHFRLLFKGHPAEFYAPFEARRYALCFSCHLAALVEDDVDGLFYGATADFLDQGANWGP